MKINPMIENNFRYHSPKEGQPEKYESIRAKAKELAYLIAEISHFGQTQQSHVTNSRKKFL